MSRPIVPPPRRTRIDFQCRYWFPRHDRPLRYERGQRLPVHEDWRWHRYSETLYVGLPPPGARVDLHLPAPFFTFSASTLQRLVFFHERGQLHVMFEMNGTRVAGPVPWRATELWTQITFDPPGGDAYPNRGPWWLRYRTPDAGDVNARMMSTLDAIDELVVMGDLPAIGHRVDEMRRELILAALGGKTR